MVEIQKGKIYKIKDGEYGEYEYVEVREKPDYTPKECKSDEWVYVCTLTPYPTSIYGQVEACGFVKKDILIPLDEKNKKDREIIERLKKVQQEGIERSQRWYNIYKSREKL